MKKIIIFALIALLGLVCLAEADFDGIPKAEIVVTVNTEGLGQIAWAEGEATPEFDEEFPSQSAYLGLPGPDTYSFAARADEGYRFIKWTKDGKTVSTEPEMTLELTESADYVAVFREYNEYAPQPVSDIKDAKTIGDVLGLPGYGYSSSEKHFVTAVEFNDVVYRVAADLDEETSQAIFQLDFDDPEYDKKFTELLSPLPIARIDDLSAQMPAQADLDALAGKTGAELLNEGWSLNGWNFEDMEFYMNHGAYAYNVKFEGEIDNYEDFGEEDLANLTVASVTCTGIGDPAFMEEE